MKEIWKDIKGYEGMYKISNFGRIKSLERMVKSNNNNYRKIKEIILKQRKDKYGYYKVSLNKDSKSKLYFVHRLVAQAFISNPNNYLCINHKDENKENNEVNNLEWCTVKYNNIYGSRINRTKEKLKIPVKQYDLNGNFIKKWDSAIEIYNKLGYDFSLIRKCCKNNRYSAYGYKWESDN